MHPIPRPLLLAAFLAWLAMPDLAAQAPQPERITFQGRLTDATGNPVTGDVEMTFSIYDADTGESPLWSETQTVVVNAGLYVVQLGAVNGFSGLTLDMTSGRWLGVQVVGDTSEMSPRYPLTGVPYARRALGADDAGTLDGLDATAFARTSHVHSASAITSGILPVVRGGTGLDDAGAAGNILVSDSKNWVRTPGTSTFIQNQATSAQGGSFWISGTAVIDLSLSARGTVELGDALTDTVTIGGTLQGATPLVFDGATTDTNRTALSVVNPTGPNMIVLPNASGTLAVSASAPLALSAAGNLSLTGGPGSGLNADLLDGLHADSFPQLSTGNTYTGANTFNNNVWFSSGVYMTGTASATAGALTMSDTARMLIDDGTALLPGLGFSPDPDTGLYLPAANTLAVTTGGVERMRVDGTGLASFAAHASIGGTLYLNGDSAASNIYKSRRTSGGFGYHLLVQAGGSEAGASNAAGGTLYLQSGISTGSADSRIEFKTYTPGTSGTTSNSATTKMALTGDGNLGVGIAAPAERVDVSGNVQASGEFQYATEKTFYLSISAAGFYQNRDPSEDDTLFVNGTSYRFATSGSAPYYAYLLANVHLPEGAIVDELTAYALDENETDNLLLQVSLTRHDLPAGTIETMGHVSLLTDGSSSTVQSESDNTISSPQIDNRGGYYLAVSMNSNVYQSLYFMGCRIRYRLRTLKP